MPVIKLSKSYSSGSPWQHAWRFSLHTSWSKRFTAQLETTRAVVLYIKGDFTQFLLKINFYLFLFYSRTFTVSASCFPPLPHSVCLIIFFSVCAPQDGGVSAWGATLAADLNVLLPEKVMRLAQCVRVACIDSRRDVSAFLEWTPVTHSVTGFSCILSPSGIYH